MMLDEILSLKVSLSWWGDLIGKGSLENHKGFGALYPQFWGLELPLSVSLSARLTHAGIVTKWMKLRSQGIHRRKSTPS